MNNAWVFVYAGADFENNYWNAMILHTFNQPWV